MGVPVVVTAVLVAGALVLLGGTRNGRGSCGEDVREPLDPRSIQHVLPGADPPQFSSAAPTSGPHFAQPVPGGVREEAMPPLLQVAALEGGLILLQHQPGLKARARDDLRALAGARVIVAPNPALEAPIVATAWRVKLTCDRADAPRLRDFVRTQISSAHDDAPAVTATSTP